MSTKESDTDVEVPSAVSCLEYEIQACPVAESFPCTV